MKILSQNDNYRAILLTSSERSNRFVITFDANREDRGLHECGTFDEFANSESYITKKGLNHIAVQSLRNDWYYYGGIEEILSSVAQFKKDNHVYITYGSSMGGFAAVEFSKEVKSDFFVAISPQATLLDEFMEKIEDPRFKNTRGFFSESRLLKNNLESQRGILVVDPNFREDVEHCELILQRTHSSLITSHGGWHHSGIPLNRTVGIIPLINNIFDCLIDSEKLKNLFSSTQKSLDASFGKKYSSSSSQECFELFCHYGINYLLHNLTVDFLLHKFRQQPDNFSALILYSAYNKKPAKFELIPEVLKNNGYWSLAVELSPTKIKLANFYNKSNREKIIDLAFSIGADSLRDEAIKFEKKDDIETAYFLMDLARKVRPNGPFIVEKVDEYKTRLANAYEH